MQFPASADRQVPIARRQKDMPRAQRQVRFGQLHPGTAGLVERPRDGRGKARIDMLDHQGRRAVRSEIAQDHLQGFDPAGRSADRDQARAAEVDRRFAAAALRRGDPRREMHLRGFAHQIGQPAIVIQGQAAVTIAFRITFDRTQRERAGGDVVPGFGRAGDNDDRGGPQPHQLFQKIEPVHSRHLDIKSDDIGIEPLDLFPSLGGAGGHADDGNVGLVAQPRGQDGAHGGAIVDHKDADRIAGDAGNDFILSGGGDDIITGGDGDDTINAVKDTDGETGYFSFTGSLDAQGEAGADIINGTSGNDRLDGGPGADKLYGDDGDDVLTGGADDDSLFGDAGNDTLFGGEGADRLYGDAGDDKAYGGLGDDLIQSGDGNDLLDGGAGADRLYGGSGDDRLDGGDGDDELLAGDGLDVLRGGAGNDRLYARSTDMAAGSDDGANQMFGDDGDDFIVGGNGNDTLDGGAGADRLFGGAGDDHYVVDNLSDYVWDQEGRNTGLVKVDFFKQSAGVAWTLDTGVKPLPYWIDALVGDGSDYVDARQSAAAGVIRYAFPDAALASWSERDKLGFTPFNADQRAYIAKVLAYVETIINVKFQLVADASQPGVLTFANNRQTGSAGYATGGLSFQKWGVFLNNTGTSAAGNRGGDIIILNHAAGDYSAARFNASTIVITSGTEKLIIPMGTIGLTLRFSDGDRTLVYKNAMFFIGDQAITATSLTPLDPATITLSADQGGPGASVILDATGKAIITDNAARTGNVFVKNFTADDVIRVTGATSGQYSFAISVADPKDLEISYMRQQPFLDALPLCNGFVHHGLTRRMGHRLLLNQTLCIRAT